MGIAYEEVEDQEAGKSKKEYINKDEIGNGFELLFKLASDSVKYEKGNAIDVINRIDQRELEDTANL